MHAQKGTTGTSVLTKNVPTSIRILHALTELNAIEITRMHHYTRFSPKFKLNCTVPKHATFYLIARDYSPLSIKGAYYGLASYRYNFPTTISDILAMSFIVCNL